jgi:hypothetical protein
MIPANPVKARAMSAVVIHAIGMPRNGLGTSASSSFSRILAIMVNAIANPIPEPKPKDRLSRKLYFSVVLIRGTAMMMQFVVIRASMVSDAWTKAATIPIKTMIFRNVISRGIITYVKATQLRPAAMVITDVKVMLIPTDVSIFLDTPKKIQRPRNLVKTKLFITEAAIKSSKSFPNSVCITSSLISTTHYIV